MRMGASCIVPAVPDSPVRHAIETRYSRFSAQQRRAADYLLNHQKTAFTQSVHELARAAGVSEATLVRFARELGFAGYLELRAALTREAIAELHPAERFALEPPPNEPAGTLERVVRTEQDNLRRTVEGLDTRAYRRFVERLGRADHVVTVGLGVSAILAQLCAYELYQIGVNAWTLSRDPLTFEEQAARLTRRSALVCFTFPPYSPPTVEVASQARARHAAVLAITDGPASPICDAAQATLFARSENLLYTNALCAAMVLVNAVVTDVALADKPRALNQLRASQRALGDQPA